MAATLDIDLLRTFVAFADTGSFTRAARQVNRTQSAVSMQMKRLEDLVGKPLYERNGRGVILTGDGSALAGYARRILSLHEEALSGFLKPDLTGTVRVGTPDDFAAALLPGLLSRFAELYPRVHLEVRCDYSDHLRRALDAGELDLAIMSFAPDDEHGTILRREPVVWATSRMHEAHLRDPVPLAVFHANCKFYIWGVQALNAAGRTYRIAYTSGSFSGIEAAVATGLAISPIARSSMTPAFRELGPEEGFPPLPMVSIGVCVAPRVRGEASARLAEHIVQSFA